MIVLVTGGVRSGKRIFAQEYINKIGNGITYIATAIPFDEGMKYRIKKHRDSRPKKWKTIEMYKSFEKLESNTDFLNSDSILFECMTLMISNLLLEENIENADYEKIDIIEKKYFLKLRKL
jgi:adenosylcobinamide kinase/adenosylcobinamide-phosphate guanylyltransferase